MSTQGLVILISGSGSNLQAFIDAATQGLLPAKINAVISNNPGVKGLERAKAAGIPTEVVNHRDFPTREAFDQALAKLVSNYNPSLVILAGFMRILTPAFVEQFLGRLMNIHPSLLPKYPGLHTHQRAIDAGDSYGGATVHFVTSELDGGPPIVQAKVPIKKGDTAEMLAKNVLTYEHKIYPLAAKWFIQGRLTQQGNKAMLDNQLLPDNGQAYSEKLLSE